MGDPRHSESDPRDGLHVGVTPWLDHRGDGSDPIAQQGERAESLGFDSFWLPESHFTRREGGAPASPSPLLRLAVVAGRTRRLKLGTTSFLLPIRHPIHVAEEVAVLDRMSGGRLILGIGRGFRPALFEVFAVPVQEKRSRFEATLESMQSAWRGEPVAWDRREGDSEPRALHLSPLPVQRPHPPVWVAAFGPKAVQQAGRLGLPYLASPVEPLEILEENYELHRVSLPESTAAGELPVPVMRTTFVSRDPDQVRQVRRILEQQASRLAASSIVNLRRTAAASIEDCTIVGTPEAVAEEVKRYRERLGMTHLIIRAHIAGVEPDVLEESLVEVRKVLRS